MTFRTEPLFARYNVTSVDALPIAFSGVSLQQGEEHGNEVFDKHYGTLFDTFQRQNNVFQLRGLAAPKLALRAISMGPAGTDFAQHRHFITAAEEYRRAIQRVMNEDIQVHQKRRQTYLARGAVESSEGVRLRRARDVVGCRQRPVVDSHSHRVASARRVGHGARRVQRGG